MRTLLVLVVGLSTTAWAQVAKTTVNVTVPNCAASPPNASYQADVYRPTSGGPFPLLAIGHGFQNSKDNYEQLARALAAEGIAVIVPQFPTGLACGSSDHARNGTILLAALDQQVSAGGIDATRVGLAGHSAGGLSSFLAAGQRALQAVFLMDATDVSSLGVTAAPNVAEPTLSVHAEPGTCNSQGNSTAWFTPKPGLKGRFKIVNGSHCEPQEPPNGFCTVGCGGSAAYSAQRAAQYKTWAVAFFGRFLLGRTAPCLDELAATEATAGRITSVDFQLGGCGGADGGTLPADAGQPPQDGGAPPVDAGTSTDAGTAGDAGTPPADAGTSTDAGSAGDGGATSGDDAGTAPEDDAGLPLDDGGFSANEDAGTGAPADGGTEPVAPPAGCGCGATPGALLGLLSLGLALRRRSARVV